MALWRKDPALKGRFLREYPDDLQILVHEGSFRFTQAQPEVMWGHTIARLDWTRVDGVKGYAYKAILLNQPNNLKTLKLGDEILFVAHASYQFPIRVTHEYMADRAMYDISPCDKCGLPELFDPIPKILELVFPDLKKQLDANPESLAAFQSFCPVCGGMMFVKQKSLIQTTAAAKPAPVTKPTAPQHTPKPDDLFTRFKNWFTK